ncbi:MAG: carbohydrate ABC transporter permease [Anaerolineae bacterium]
MKRRSVGTFLLHAGLTLAGLSAIFPFLWMLLLSLQETSLTLTAPALRWPWPLSLANYVNAWHAIPLARYYANSLLVAGVVALGQVITGLLAGYVFARLQFRGRDLLFLLFLGTLLVPTEVTLIPSFLLMRWLGWVDRLPALTVPFLAHPTAIFLLRQYLLTLPGALEDAARMDGCSHLQVLWYIFIPLALPAAGVVGLFSFLWSWKAFVWPLVIIQTPARYTIPVGLAMLQSELGTDWPMLMAATALATLPVLLLYAAIQRRVRVFDYGF